MTFSQKENSLLQDLKTQEQLCVEKYSEYSNQACDPNLKNLFSSIGKTEQDHLNTINQLINGTVPQIGSQNVNSQSWNGRCGTSCSADQQKKDKFLCSDALSMEKHVSSLYDTSIFEFSDVNVRNLLNHIQKEEQQHGEQLYAYMSQCGMQLQ